MKKILYIFITILIGLIIYFYIDLKNDSINNNTIKNSENNLIQIHNGQKISELLTQENYEKVGINPEKYKNFEEFLIEFKTFTGVDLDPINEKFSIGIKKENGNTLYIPFDFKNSGNAFDDEQNKNLAILDIYSSYKSGMLFGGVDSLTSGNKIIFEEDITHPETKELNKIFNTEVNVFKYIDSLNKTTQKTLPKEELLSYLYDFVGDYSQAKENRKKICEEFKICNENLSKIIIEGQTNDDNNSPMAGVKVELLNDTSINTITDTEGKFKLEFNWSSFAHLRVKASKEGYSDGFVNYSLTKSTNEDIKVGSTITLNKYSDKITITKENSESLQKGKYYVIKTDYSTYFVPRDGLYFEDGTKYTQENFVVYTYQFTKSSNMTNLLENDTFEPVLGYVGNIMKTFGMPYIQFIDLNTKKELFVKSSNPMILQNQIYHMKELYENYDQIYEAVTKEDMKVLYKYSQENDGYPIDFDYLIKNKFLRWPARWVLDRKTGIWENIGQKLLNEDGLVELPFYSIKDN